MKSLFPRIFPVLVIVSMMLASCTMPDVTPNPNTLPTPTAILAAEPNKPRAAKRRCLGSYCGK